MGFIYTMKVWILNIMHVYNSTLIISNYTLQVLPPLVVGMGVVAGEIGGRVRLNHDGDRWISSDGRTAVIDLAKCVFQIIR